MFFEPENNDKGQCCRLALHPSSRKEALALVLADLVPLSFLPKQGKQHKETPRIDFKNAADILQFVDEDQLTCGYLRR